MEQRLGHQGSMAPSNSYYLYRSTLLLLLFITILSQFSIYALGHQLSYPPSGRRVLLSFKETLKGTNDTFECSPSGPCVACLHSEKKAGTFRCSETGYRIPFKCVKIDNGSKQTNSKKSQKSRSTLENLHDQAIPTVILHEAELATSRPRVLLDDSSTSEGGLNDYIIYRSCIPATNEEKLSLLGFEGIVLCMLMMSGSVIYFRRKRASGNVMPGAGTGRIQMSRF